MDDNLILIVTNKEDITTDLVVKRLRQRRISFVRFNTEDFPFEVHGKICISQNETDIVISAPKWNIDKSHIKTIWYRRPKLTHYEHRKLSDEDRLFAYRETNAFFLNLWSVLLENKWVNDPFALYKSERKALQLSVASQVGLKIPDTLVTNNYADFIKFKKNYRRQIVAKPLSHGGYGSSDEFAIFATDLSESSFFHDSKNVELSPFILQEKVLKKSDIRLTVFGEKVFAYKIEPINKQANYLDWRRFKPAELQYKRIDPPQEIIACIYKFMNYFNLRFGAFDFSINEQDEWLFLEVNPNGQFGWLEIATGDKLVDALIELLIN